MVNRSLIIFFIFCLFCNAGYSSELLREEAFNHYNEGLRQQVAGDFKNALTNYQRALIIDKNSLCRKFILNNTGLMYIEQGKAQEAELAFKDALALDTNYDTAAFNLSLLYLKMAKHYKETGDEKMASDYFEKAFAYYSDKTFIVEGEKQYSE